ncbi:MAG TPA: hypothetical protein VGM22_23120, partial [Methylomirabilota bacterium]
MHPDVEAAQRLGNEIAELSAHIGSHPGIRCPRRLGPGGRQVHSKARALTRVATSQTEERLLTFAKNGTASHVEKLSRAWRRVDRNAENREAEEQ